VIAEFAAPPTLVHMCDRHGACRDATVAELVPFIFHLKK
jgi:cytidine deaminase